MAEAGLWGRGPLPAAAARPSPGVPGPAPAEPAPKQPRSARRALVRTARPTTRPRLGGGWPLAVLRWLGTLTHAKQGGFEGFTK